MGSCDVDALQTTDAGYGVPAWQKCATWQSGTVTLMLALEVAGDCSINIKPIGDDTCSDPGAVLDAFKLTPLTTTEKYTYTYNNLVMRAYYTSTTKIRSLLPSTVDGARWAGAALAVCVCVCVGGMKQLLGQLLLEGASGRGS